VIFIPSPTGCRNQGVMTDNNQKLIDSAVLSVEAGTVR
jgi:hypothetical protein